MTDTKSPIRESGHLAALKTALVAEQRVLGLNTHIVRTRTDALLDEKQGEALSIHTPSAVTGKEPVLPITHDF